MSDGPNKGMDLYREEPGGLVGAAAVNGNETARNPQIVVDPEFQAITDRFASVIGSADKVFTPANKEHSSDTTEISVMDAPAPSELAAQAMKTLYEAAFLPDEEKEKAFNNAIEGVYKAIVGAFRPEEDILRIVDSDSGIAPCLGAFEDAVSFVQSKITGKKPNREVTSSIVGKVYDLYIRNMLPGYIESAREELHRGGGADGYALEAMAMFGDAAQKMVLATGALPSSVLKELQQAGVPDPDSQPRANLTPDDYPTLHALGKLRVAHLVSAKMKDNTTGNTSYEQMLQLFKGIPNGNVSKREDIVVTRSYASIMASLINADLRRITTDHDASKPLRNVLSVIAGDGLEHAQHGNIFGIEGGFIPPSKKLNAALLLLINPENQSKADGLASKTQEGGWTAPVASVRIFQELLEGRNINPAGNAVIDFIEKGTIDDFSIVIDTIKGLSTEQRRTDTSIQMLSYVLMMALAARESGFISRSESGADVQRMDNNNRSPLNSNEGISPWMREIFTRMQPIIDELLTDADKPKPIVEISEPIYTSVTEEPSPRNPEPNSIVDGALNYLAEHLGPQLSALSEEVVRLAGVIAESQSQNNGENRGDSGGIFSGILNREETPEKVAENNIRALWSEADKLAKNLLVAGPLGSEVVRMVIRESLKSAGIELDFPDTTQTEDTE
jgi:hypothetical protein